MNVTAIRPVVSGARVPQPARESFTISCEDCVLRRTDACADCIVTFICGREVDDAVIVDVAEVAAWRMLADEGLVPELRHRRLVKLNPDDTSRWAPDKPAAAFGASNKCNSAAKGVAR